MRHPPKCKGLTFVIQNTPVPHWSLTFYFQSWVLLHGKDKLWPVTIFYYYKLITCRRNVAHFCRRSSLNNKVSITFERHRTAKSIHTDLFYLLYVVHFLLLCNEHFLHSVRPIKTSSCETVPLKITTRLMFSKSTKYFSGVNLKNVDSRFCIYTQFELHHIV